MKSLSEFLANNDLWHQLRIAMGGLTQAEKPSRRYRVHFPGYTKQSKRSARNHRRVRNRMARLSRRINRRRAG